MFIPELGVFHYHDAIRAIGLTALTKYVQSAPKLPEECFQHAKQALRFCNVRHYAVCDALAHLTLSDVGEAAGQRDRVLSDRELADLWRFGKEEHGDIYFSRLIKLLILFVPERQNCAAPVGVSGISFHGSGQFHEGIAKIVKKLFVQYL